MTTQLVAMLLTYALHSSIFIGAAWLLCRFVKRPELQETAYKFALVAAVLTAGAQVAANVGTWAEQVSLQAPLVVEQSAPPVAGEASMMLADLEAAIEQKLMQGQPNVAAAGQAVGTTRIVAAQTVWTWQRIVVVAWASGALVSLLLLLLAMWRLRLAMRDRRDVGGAMAAAHRQLCADFGLDAVRLSQSERISSPIALGLWRKEVCVPKKAVSDLGVSEQRALLSHELAHLSRRDPLWRVAGRVLQGVFFFQPLNLLANRKIAACSEYVCDDIAAATTDKPIALASCLTEVADWVLARPVPAVVPSMAGERSELGRRVDRLLCTNRRLSTRSPRWALALGLLLIAAAAMSAPGVTGAAVPDQLEQAAPSPKSKATPTAKSDHDAQPAQSETGPTAPVNKAPVDKANATKANEATAPDTAKVQKKTKTAKPMKSAKVAKTKAPKTKAPKTKAPKTKAPKTKVPKTKVPKTKAPKTKAPKTKAPKTKAPKERSESVEELRELLKDFKQRSSHRGARAQRELSRVIRRVVTRSITRDMNRDVQHLVARALRLADGGKASTEQLEALIDEAIDMAKARLPSDRDMRQIVRLVGDVAMKSVSPELKKEVTRELQKALGDLPVRKDLERVLEEARREAKESLREHNIEATHEQHKRHHRLAMQHQHMKRERGRIEREHERIMRDFRRETKQQKHGSCKRCGQKRRSAKRARERAEHARERAEHGRQRTHARLQRVRERVERERVERVRTSRRAVRRDRVSREKERLRLEIEGLRGQIRKLEKQRDR